MIWLARRTMVLSFSPRPPPLSSSEAGEGLAEVGFGDAVGVEQDGFDLTAFAARLRHGTAQVMARENLLVDQVIKFAWSALYHLRLIAQCEPKRFGNV